MQLFNRKITLVPREYNSEVCAVLRRIYHHHKVLNRNTSIGMKMEVTVWHEYSFKVLINGTEIVSKDRCEYTKWNIHIDNNLKEGIISNLKLFESQLKYEAEEFSAKQKNEIQEALNSSLSTDLDSLLITAKPVLECDC
jgi:hypothetical protein